MSSLIELKNIYKSYHNQERVTPVLQDINLSINAGECVAIMGSSGAGKSTLMHLIGLLDVADQGDYFLDGQATTHLNDDARSKLRNHAIGFVFQSFFLLPNYTAQENIVLPLLYQNIDTEIAKERANKLLKNLNMADYGDRRPNQLSGGQQQRVAIARALAAEPKIILADEPTGALDSKTGDEVMELFLNLQKQFGVTLIIVTHDSKVAGQCERIISMQDGKIYADTK